MHILAWTPNIHILEFTNKYLKITMFKVKEHSEKNRWKVNEIHQSVRLSKRKKRISWHYKQKIKCDLWNYE